MSNINIRKLVDPNSGEQFYPQTDINGLVNNGGSGVDDEPVASSSNLVNSGGVFNSVISSGVFDLSAHTGDSYADLSAALTAMNSLTAAYKKGGMSIKFVQSSDNKYVQYFLTKNTWSASEGDWEKIDLGYKLYGYNEDTSINVTTIWEARTGKTINSNGGIVSNSGYNVYVIPCAGCTHVSGIASAYRNEYMVAFYNGDPSGSTFISGIKAATVREDEAFNTNIPTDAVYVVLENSLLASVPSGILIKPVHVYGDIDQLQEETQELESTVAPIVEQVNGIVDDLEGLPNAFEEMVGEYTPHAWIPVTWGEVVSGKYWNLVDNEAGLVSSAGYYAKPTLFPVNPGQKMKVTVKNSIIDDNTYAAFAGYDNDGLPAYSDGTVARVNFNKKNTVVDNGDGTSTYTFVLGDSVTQVGLFYKSEEVTFYLEQTEQVNYSEILDAHIEQVAGGGETTSADSAKYYLKGAAPKSFPNTKKIAILCAGQSNAEGRVPYSDMPADIQSAQPIANCHYVEDSVSEPFASLNITGQWAFDLVTYYNLCVTANKEIYVMKWAVGGTSIDPLGDGASHWTADYEELSSISKSLLYKLETEIRNHIETDGEYFDIRAMLWHQGEGDRGSLGTGADDRYYDNLRNMVSYIRGVVGNERLPFITGTISHNSAQYDAKIEAAQQRLASEDPYFCLIDMSGAPLQDSYHFDDDSSIYLGQMAYNALIDYGVLSATKLTPTRPW